MDNLEEHMPLNDDTIGTLLETKPRKVWAVAPGTSVFDALSLMADQDIGAVLVMDGDRLRGVMSERDYARKVILTGKNSRETDVEEIMSEPGIGTRSTTIDECMREMTATRCRHMPIVEDGRVLGVVSIGDLVNWVISAQERTISDLHAYVAGDYPR
jgi:CBS domain-containing protein